MSSQPTFDEIYVISDIHMGAIDSTHRQFKRYVDWWTDEKWSAIAARAMETLTRPGSD